MVQIINEHRVVGIQKGRKFVVQSIVYTLNFTHEN